MGGKIMYVIRLERSDRFWTQQNEWGSLSNAEMFTEAEKLGFDLPIGGVWIDCLEPLGEEELPAC